MTTEPNPLNELLTMKEAYEAAVKGRGQEVLDFMFHQFFADFPAVHSVKWRQYTPYFNDGDPCTFSVTEPYFGLNPKHPLVASRHPEEEDDDDNWGLTEEEVKARQDFGSIAYYDSYCFYSSSAYNHETKTRNFTYVSAEQEELHKGVRAINEALGQIKDILEAVFNDHVTIVASRAGYNVEEYSHD